MQLGTLWVRRNGGFAVFLAALVAVMAPSAMAASPSEAAATNGLTAALVPYPKAMETRPGQFEFTTGTRIIANDAGWKRLGQVLSGELALLTGTRPVVTTGKARAGDILLAAKRGIEGEGYELRVDKVAAVRAGNYAAAAMGTASLLQSLSGEMGRFQVPCQLVRDEPFAEYRGLLVDLGRQWHPVEVIKQLVVLCHWYKIRYFHLHLSDDALFTFPSTAFPKLPTPNRHYTLEQLRELETFATDRGVIIIPEMDCPSHATTLIKGLPELLDTDPPNGAALCAGREETYRALDTIIGEMCAVFRATPYFHLGADELDYNRWQKCKYTQAYLAAHNIPDVHELYRHFIVRMNEIVKKHGKQTIVWEGFARTGQIQIPKDIIVMEYESKYNLPQDVVADGYRVINASWQPLYIVPGRRWSPEYIYGWNMYRWENWWDQSKAYPKGIQLPPTPQVIGAQMCSWEQGPNQEIPSLRERLAALSERIWNPQAGRSYQDFAARLQSTDAKLSRLLALP